MHHGRNTYGQLVQLHRSHKRTVPLEYSNQCTVFGPNTWTPIPHTTHPRTQDCHFVLRIASNSGVDDSDVKHFWTNGLVLLTSFTLLFLTYLTFAVPWAHEWRLGRAGACVFLGIYLVWLLVYGAIGAIAAKPWFV